MKRILIIGVILALVIGGISCGKSEPGTTPQTPTENGDSSPDNTPPSITNISASDITETSATITWATDEPATSQVEYGETADYGLSTTLDEELVTSHSVSLSGLEPNTIYHFRVKSKDEAGNEAASEDKTFTTSALPDTTPPMISEVNVSNIAESSATITWTTNEPATSQVEYGTTSAYGLSSPLDTNLVTSHSASLSNLASNTAYHFRIKSKDASDNLAVSEDYSFSTLSVPIRGLTVHFIDVGQGDSILIDLDEIEVLIDGGRKSPGVVGYLNNYVDGSLEVMVATCPHADHIGGLIAVLDAFEVDEIWLNEDTSTSQTYAEFMAAVDLEGAEVHEARRGGQIEAGGLTLIALNPLELSGSTNNNSIVLSLSYGEVDFLFTGDAEKEAEASMLGAGIVPNVEILKVGHHGSRTASSQAFLEVVQPEVAVYMAREGNQYGHPHEETISALQTIGALIYGTDVNSTILVTTDGLTYTVETQEDSNVQITYIFYDGLVYQVESDEYVEIKNLGNAPQDLKGWVLKDISEGYPSFTFPSYILSPGESVRVYTNQYHPEWGGFSFDYGKAIWDNSYPDIAALYNAEGQEVSRKSYWMS